MLAGVTQPRLRNRRRGGCTPADHRLAGGERLRSARELRRAQHSFKLIFMTHEFSEIELRRLDLNLLLVFSALMRERSVAKAARRLYLGPSAVSMALARLRDTIGDP